MPSYMFFSNAHLYGAHVQVTLVSGWSAQSPIDIGGLPEDRRLTRLGKVSDKLKGDNADWEKEFEDWGGRMKEN